MFASIVQNSAGERLPDAGQLKQFGSIRLVQINLIGKSFRHNPAIGPIAGTKSVNAPNQYEKCSHT
jgi:hypothetical protein